MTRKVEVVRVSGIREVEIAKQKVRRDNWYAFSLKPDIYGTERRGVGTAHAQEAVV